MDLKECHYCHVTFDFDVGGFRNRSDGKYACSSNCIRKISKKNGRGYRIYSRNDEVVETNILDKTLDNNHMHKLN